MADLSSHRSLLDLSVKDFLGVVASEAPAPGGGSVAALAGALGAGLVAMVAGLTLGRQKYAAVEAEMRDVLTRAEALRQRLAGLVDADTAAYAAVMAAYRLSKDTDAARERRTAAIQAALRHAAEVPLEVAGACADVLALAALAAAHGNHNAASDAAVGALAANTGLQGAIRNVRINLQSIEDAVFGRETEARVAGLEAVGAAALHDALAAVDARG